MKTDRILLPVDLTGCPLDVLPLINTLADHPTEVTVILLHVISLNVLLPETRIYQDLLRESRQRLQRLAREYVRPGIDTQTRVRLGQPFDEILAEAKEQQVRLILLPVRQASLWKRFFAPILPRVAEKLTRNAPCPVYAVPFQNAFDCMEHWVPEPAPAGSPQAGFAVERSPFHSRKFLIAMKHPQGALRS